jgi:biopolymer transport protein ExbB
LERNLGMLIAIGYICPLIGLLGTVTGLIQAFVQLSANNGYATLADVSGGIYESLLTTAAGLVVAIPTILAYCYLSARLNALLHDMERAGIEIVSLLSESETDSSIIEFAPESKSSREHR